MLKKFLDFLFPVSCPICGIKVSEHGQICASCWNKFDWISDPKCDRCGFPFPANIEKQTKMLCPNCLSKKTKLDWMRSSCVYDDASRNVVLPFKHASRLEFRNLMARAMIATLREFPVSESSELIVVPVPLANKRLFKRGYNQSSLIARPMAKYLNTKLDYDLVSRIFRSDMGHKSPKERKKNISGVFKILKPIAGKKILIVDDVYTTGATLNELTKILKKAGAIWVGGVTFCRTVKAI